MLCLVGLIKRTGFNLYVVYDYNVGSILTAPISYIKGHIDDIYNAKMCGNDVITTNGSISNLPVLDTNGFCVSNAYVQVLCSLVYRGEVLGYRVITPSMQVESLSTNSVLSLLCCSKCFNAKVDDSGIVVGDFPELQIIQGGSILYVK